MDYNILYILTILDFPLAILTLPKYTRATRMLPGLSIVGFKNWKHEFSPTQTHVIQESSTNEGIMVINCIMLVIKLQFMKRKRDTEQHDETDSSQTQILIGERWVVPDMTCSRAGLAIHILVNHIITTTDPH